MKTTSFLKVAGIINLILAAFHAAFPLVFNWPESIAMLDADNFGIYMNLAVVGVILIAFFAYTNLYLTQELVSSKLGKAVLFLMLLFYLVRIFAEFLLFKPDLVFSSLIVIICGFLVLVYFRAVFFVRPATIGK